MARICERCGRGSLKSATRSHSNIATLRRLRVNLQRKVVDGRRLAVCTSCIRNLSRAPGR